MRSWKDGRWVPSPPLDVLRDQGHLVCRCSTPEPIWLRLWADYECGRCGKAMVW